MGRSTSSCFKMITCGGDSAEKDDPLVPENKGSGDKRGWSFRKRSARHRVLSNTVISETPSRANKESSESTGLNFQPPDASIVPEKISVIQCTDEKSQLSTSADSKGSETIVATKDDSDVDDHMEESTVIVIQTAVRGFLAQRELLRLKNLVKMQAAVRGHLVRQHAVGTLRCVQAIVKMQALVRARQARAVADGSHVEKKLDVKDEKGTSKTLEKENSITMPNVTYTSIEKLLNNRFARQLMDSTPKNRPIHIKCDTSKPNSAWSWLERWMAVSSAESTPKPELRTEQLEMEKNENLKSPVDATLPHEGFSDMGNSRPNTKETVLPSESEENLVYDTDNFEFHGNHSMSAVGDNVEQPQLENISGTDAKETLIDTNSRPNQELPSNANSQAVLSSHHPKPEIEGEQSDHPKRSMKRSAPEQLETEGKKFIYGSKKASNSAFTAVQSKFEAMSAAANSNRSVSSLSQDVGVESNMERVPSGVDTVMRAKELNVTEESVPNNSRVQYGGSECGTELSVTSTLDSPDRSEVGAAENEHEAKVLQEETHNTSSMKDVDIDAGDAYMASASNLSHIVTDQPEKPDGAKNEFVSSITAVDSTQAELRAERSASDFQRELDSEIGGPAYRSSPEPSPRSHITIPESQATPSSQVSMKAEKNRTKKSGSNQKRKSLSAAKRSPSNPNHDSGARSSTEQLSREQKNGKRRNSFGSTRPEHTEEEPRDSSGSSSLPHFMQATESARAKIQASNSPRSSPDVQDREYIMKRQSLPGGNGRQGSPQIQRSTSQARQGTKGNVSHAVHEKRWQR